MMRYKKVMYVLRLFFVLSVVISMIGCAGINELYNQPSEPAIGLTEAPSTDIPTVSPEVPVPTNEPAVTEEPVPTNEPAVTEEPAPTNEPAVTEEPVPTEMPVATVTPVPTATPGLPVADFYRVDGTAIVDSENNPVLLKGIAMGNMVWDSLEPPENDHNEESFRELSELGFNSVRFYLSYHYFEDDQTPYVYKESGFEWLDQNIAWAKKYGLRLVLNMHAPQGGYQSLGEGLALWQEPENQKRLISLWAEIARRYAEEEAIIGYGLINEPVVPLLEDPADTFAQCPELMQRITDEIRKYDKNHIIFAERVCAVRDPATGESVWPIAYEDVLYLLEDDNTVYEFHSYVPHSFTHQNMEWADTAGVITEYPSENPVFYDVISYWTGCMGAVSKETLKDGWVRYESEFTALSENGNAGSITLQAAYAGSNGTVFFDDVVVEEYKDGSFQRVVTSLDFENGTSGDDFNYWSGDGSGTYFYSDGGYNGGRCVAISGTTDDANITGYCFALREGYEYKITGKVKYSATDVKCTACPRIDYSLYGKITSCDYNYLEQELLPYLEFGDKNQVPVYMGEFGVCIPAWEQGTGADRWVTDMLTLCYKYQIHFNYHSYHDYWFGLHRLPTDSPDTERNSELAEIFKEMLKK